MYTKSRAMSSLLVVFAIILTLLTPALAAADTVSALDGMVTITGVVKKLDTHSVIIPSYDFFTEPESNNFHDAAFYQVNAGATVTLNRDMALFFPHYARPYTQYPASYFVEMDRSINDRKYVIDIEEADDVSTTAGVANGAEAGNIYHHKTAYQKGESITFHTNGLYAVVVSDNAETHMGMDSDLTYGNARAILIEVVNGPDRRPNSDFALADYGSRIYLKDDTKYLSINPYVILDVAQNPTNYVQLREIASALSGTAAQFDVQWDAASSAIQITTEKAYADDGSRFRDGKAVLYTANTSQIYIDGVPVELAAYTIGENNYFKLRDLGKALGFNVTWDQERKSITMDPNSPYAE